MMCWLGVYKVIKRKHLLVYSIVQALFKPYLVSSGAKKLIIHPMPFWYLMLGFVHVCREEKFEAKVGREEIGKWNRP